MPRSSAPTIEALESRLLLSAPQFATAMPEVVWWTKQTAGGDLTLGIDGSDADADPLTITATSDNPAVAAQMVAPDQFARLHFTDSTGNDIGDIVVQLFGDYSQDATDRFVTLATDNVDASGNTIPADATHPAFYTDVLVHRVIPGFMVQTGDAQLGDGTGTSPLGEFNDTFDPNLSFAWRGSLAMANSGANTNDCQFFITADATPWLNQVHMIFGQVISGWDVYNTIINTPTKGGTGTDADRPVNPPV